MQGLISFFSIFQNKTVIQKVGTAVAVGVPALTTAILFLSQVRSLMCQAIPYLGIVVDCSPITSEMLK